MPRQSVRSVGSGGIRGNGFVPGRSGNPRGRPKGVPNKATQEIRGLARGLLLDPIYLRSLKKRLIAGTAGPVEVTLFQYAFGRPKDEVVPDVPIKITLTFDDKLPLRKPIRPLQKPIRHTKAVPVRAASAAGVPPEDEEHPAEPTVIAPPPVPRNPGIIIRSPAYVPEPRQVPDAWFQRDAIRSPRGQGLR